jgi:outer membrane immunogenic protein
MIRNILTALGILLVLTASASPAWPADLDRPPASADEPAEPLRPPIWQGLYFGLSAGYGWGNSEHFYDRNDNHGTAQQNLDGWLGGITVGYNYLLSPNLLIGVEGDLGFMDLGADDKVIFDGHVWKSQFGGLWGTVRARAGFLWGDRTLIYGTGGVAFMQVDEVGYGDADGQTAWNTDFRTGWVVGGGIEYAISPKMTTKIEYLHMDFGRYNGFSENREDYYFDNSVDVVRAGVSFKF